MKALTKHHAFVKSTNFDANERFIHLRNVNMAYENGRVVKDVTAFVRVVNGKDFVSFAECDDRDQFCKAAGRNVARRKFFQGKRQPLITIETVSDNTSQRAKLYEEVSKTYTEN